MKIKYILFIMLGIFMISSVSALSWNSSFESGLISYWSLDTNGTDNFASNNLAMVGTTANHLTSGCMNLGCYNFTGSVSAYGTAYLANTTATGFPSGNSASTMNVWWRRRGYISPMEFEPAIFYGDAVNNRFLSAYRNNITIVGQYGVATPNVVNDTMYDYNWHLITYVHYDNNTNAIYLDGTIATASNGALTSGTTGIYIGGDGATGTYYNTTGMLDEPAIWNRALTAGEINSLWNSGIGLFKTSSVSLDFPPDNYQTAYNTIGFNATLQSPVINLTNATLFVWYNNGTVFNSTTNILGSTSTSSWSISNFGKGSYKWNAYLCAVNNVCYWSSTNSTLTVGEYVINSVTYNPTTTSGSVELFTLNLTYPSSSFSGISVILNYNNTNYTITSTGSGDNLIFSRNIIVPTVSSPTNATFYWIIALSNSSGINYFQTSSSKQLITQFLVDDCSSYTKRLMNITMVDEDSLQGINGTVELAINFFTQGTGNLIGTYNNTFNYTTPTPIAICLNNITTSYDISYQIRYYSNVSSYFKQYKIVQLATINNATLNQNIVLYDLLAASGYPFKIIVVGSPLLTQNSNLLIEASRQYLALDKFIAVEDSLTDSDGNGILHLVPNSEIYNFIISYNGQILGTFNNNKVQCQNVLTPQCTITLNLGEATGTTPDFNNYGHISTFYTTNNATQTISFTFTSTDGFIHTVTQTVTDASGSVILCNNTGVGTSGTILCTLPIAYQNTNVWSTVYSDGIFVENKFFSFGAIINYFGVDIIIELLMFSCLVMLFLNNPILIVIGSVLGFSLSVLLLFVAGGNIGAIIGVVIFYIVAAGLIIFQIGRKI